MKVKSRLLTVKEFALEKGITRETVYNWILKGRLKDVINPGGMGYLIPESNLSVEKCFAGRPKGSIYKTPIATIDDARERYNSNRYSNYNRTIPLSFDELYELFRGETTQEQVAQLTGVSRQRVQQVYKMYFAPFLSSGEARRRRLFRERWAEKAKAHVDTVEGLSIIKRIAEEKGFKVESIQADYNPSYCYSNRLLINGKLCRIYLSLVPGRVGPKNLRKYFKVNITKAAIKDTEFVIVITGNEVRRVFIFPTKLLQSQFYEKHINKIFYLPEKQLPPYQNQHPNIDWWTWEDAWSQLE
jgi:transcriptional regulator with XRE-family HTH domain